MALPILCYHKTGPLATEGRRLNIEPDRLDSHIRYFHRRSCAFLQARQLCEPWPNKAVCFTFDDAYHSTLQYAPQLFAEKGLAATIYAVPSKVGQKADWDGGDNAPLATWDALLEAQSQGIEIGNHTHTHARMETLGLQDQIREIQMAHDLLSSHELTPGSFCHPYGGHNATTLEALQHAGYRVALALGKRPALPTDPMLALPRIVLAYSDGLPMLIYKLHIRHRLP